MVQTGKWNKGMLGPPTEKMLRQNYHSAVIPEKPRMSRRFESATLHDERGLVFDLLDIKNIQPEAG
jgi:hypothetical protein